MLWFINFILIVIVALGLVWFAGFLLYLLAMGLYVIFVEIIYGGLICTTVEKIQKKKALKLKAEQIRIKEEQNRVKAEKAEIARINREHNKFMRGVGENEPIDNNIVQEDKEPEEEHRLTPEEEGARLKKLEEFRKRLHNED